MSVCSHSSISIAICDDEEDVSRTYFELRAGMPHSGRALQESSVYCRVDIAQYLCMSYSISLSVKCNLPEQSDPSSALRTACGDRR